MTLFPVGQLSVILLLFYLLGNTGEMAYASDDITTAEQPTGVVEKGGEFIPLEAAFTNEKGEQVTLAGLIDKPTLLLPVYYTCPRVCSFDMANLALALQLTKLDHDSFNVVTFSFNDQETTEDAANAKKNYTHMLKDHFSTESWSFLTGDLANIQLVTQSIGYTFKPVGGGLYIHPSAMVAVGKNGKIIKYVYGAFLSGDVDLALSEAERGTPATSIRRFLAYCLEANPERNKIFFTIMKVSALLLVGAGGFYLVRLLRKGRQ